MPSLPRIGIPRTLKEWDRYQVLEVLGAGGMGAVYKARDPRLNRFVALKIVHPGLGHAAETRAEFFVRRFVREARLQASLDHPHICKVYEIGELPPNDNGEAGFPFIAMQLIGGKPLHVAQAEMSLFDKVRVIKQVADALHTAHRQGLIHRDIKPSNIMVERTPEGGFHPYVMDFGLARDAESSEQTRSGVIEGTPRFMSPEQARGDSKRLDRRTDVYSLGITLYELLVGQSPYSASGDGDLLLAVMTQEPAPLRSVDRSIPIDLEAVTLKSIEKDLDLRYDSAKAFADDLGRYLDGDTVEARRSSVLLRLYRRARKHKGLVAVSCVIFVAILGLGVYGLRARLAAIQLERQAKQQAQLAQRLGQQIKDMEWLMRSARQLPLHDLNREKVIVRARMKKLESELLSQGELARGLSHYALGRGYLALREYRAAHEHIVQAIAQGQTGAEVYYALGLTLSKLFHSALAEEVELIAGSYEEGLKLFGPKYLEPALAALRRSRELDLDAPAYLEGLIARYERDYPATLRHAKLAIQQAPWMYEAHKLAGDAHREISRDLLIQGKIDESEGEAALATREYETAVAMGQSDAEVYEVLALLKRNQLSVAAMRGEDIDARYRAVIQLLDQMEVAEPENLEPPLSRATVALLTLVAAQNIGRELNAERLAQCFTQAERIVKRVPEHGIARNVLASCYQLSAQPNSPHAKTGELLLQAVSVLGPTVERYPKYFSGVASLGEMYAQLAMYQILRGESTASQSLDKAELYLLRAAAIESMAPFTYPTQLYALLGRAALVRAPAELASLLAKADALLAKGIESNDSDPILYANHAGIYVQAAQRAYLTGGDPQPSVGRALASLAIARKKASFLLLVEQLTVQAHYLQAASILQRGNDPTSELVAARTALKACLDGAAKDPRCHSLSARLAWLEADWRLHQRQSPLASLQLSQQAARRATESTELHPDAWQALAETELRLAQQNGKQPATRAAHLEAGLQASERLAALNPQHRLGLETQARLWLLRAQTTADRVTCRSAAQSALTALELASRADPSVPVATDALAQARALAAGAD